MPSASPPNQDSAPPQSPSQFYRIAWVFYLILALVAVVWIGTSRGEIPLTLLFDPDGWWIDVASVPELPWR